MVGKWLSFHRCAFCAPASCCVCILWSCLLLFGPAWGSLDNLCGLHLQVWLHAKVLEAGMARQTFGDTWSSADMADGGHMLGHQGNMSDHSWGTVTHTMGAFTDGNTSHVWRILTPKLAVYPIPRVDFLQMAVMYLLQYD